jgi:hypothetical protein
MAALIRTLSGNCSLRYTACKNSREVGSALILQDFRRPLRPLGPLFLEKKKEKKARYVETPVPKFEKISQQLAYVYYENEPGRRRYARKSVIKKHFRKLMHSP